MSYIRFKPHLDAWPKNHQTYPQHGVKNHVTNHVFEGTVFYIYVKKNETFVSSGVTH